MTCKHHLDGPESCLLDVTDRGAATEEEVAKILGTTPRRIRQIAAGALAKLRLIDIEFDEREHPEDPYLKYTNLGAEEVAELSAILRARAKEGR